MIRLSSRVHKPFAYAVCGDGVGGLSFHRHRRPKHELVRQLARLHSNTNAADKRQHRNGATS